MSLLDNDQIASDVRKLVAGYVKQSVDPRNPTKPRTAEEIELMEAGVRLVINFLQNLNDLAYAASNFDTANRQ